MKKYYRLLLGLSAILIGLLGTSSRVRAMTHCMQSVAPTIFVYGWGGSSHAEERMANAARDADITNTIVRANVDRKEKVTFRRPIPTDAVNPIVKVSPEDNRLSAYRDNYTQGYHHDGEHVKNVVLALGKQHHYKQISLVGYSMGSLEIINYINDNVSDKSFPQVVHLVAIAGHYNGLVGQSETQSARIDPKTDELEKMNSAYHELLGLRQTFPKNTTMLSVYGDVEDDNHSSEDTPVNSAKPLKYLVSDRANHITRLRFTERIPSTVSSTIAVE